MGNKTEKLDGLQMTRGTLVLRKVERSCSFCLRSTYHHISLIVEVILFPWKASHCGTQGLWTTVICKNLVTSTLSSQQLDLWLCFSCRRWQVLVGDKHQSILVVTYLIGCTLAEQLHWHVMWFAKIRLPEIANNQIMYNWIIVYELCTC